MTLTVLAIWPTKPACFSVSRLTSVSAQQLQIGQGDFSVELEQVRLETTLGQTTLQRHLTAFKTHLVVAARARLLTLVTTT